MSDKKINLKNPKEFLVFVVLMAIAIVSFDWVKSSFFESESTAKKLGFSSLVEYKEYKSRGFKKMDDVVSGGAIKAENFNKVCRNEEDCIGQRVTWRGFVDRVKNGDDVTVNLLGSNGHHHNFHGTALLMGLKDAEKIDKSRIIYFDGTFVENKIFTGHHLKNPRVFKIENDQDFEARRQLQEKWDMAADREAERCKESSMLRGNFIGNIQMPITAGDVAHNKAVRETGERYAEVSNKLNSACKSVVAKMRTGEYQK